MSQERTEARVQLFSYMLNYKPHCDEFTCSLEHQVMPLHSIILTALTNPSSSNAWDSVTSVPVRWFVVLLPFGPKAVLCQSALAFYSMSVHAAAAAASATQEEIVVRLDLSAYDIALLESVIFHKRGDSHSTPLYSSVYYECQSDRRHLLYQAACSLLLQAGHGGITSLDRPAQSVASNAYWKQRARWPTEHK